MWRAMPLIKMVVRITAVCAVVPVAELYLHTLVFYDGSVIISNQLSSSELLWLQA